MRYELYLLKYNNFMEHKSFVGHSITYLLSIATKYIPVNGNNEANINIKFNDGIYADLGPLVINDNNNTMLMYNYAVIHDTLTDTYTRWFILPGSSMISGNKFTCRLNRDTIAENYVEISNSKGFIERGILNDSSPLSLLKENFSCNQIKVKQFPIVDFNNRVFDNADGTFPWLYRKDHILVFIDRKQLTSGNITISFNAIPFPDIKLMNDITHYEYYEYVNAIVAYPELYLKLKAQDMNIIQAVAFDQNNNAYAEYYQVSFEDYSTADTVQGMLKLKLIKEGTIEYLISDSSFNQAIINAKNPYIVLAIPYYDDGDYSKITAYQILNALQDQLGSSILDIQLTPYSSDLISKGEEIIGQRTLDGVITSMKGLRYLNTDFMESIATVNYSEEVAANNNQNKMLVNTKDYYIKSPTGVNSYNFNIAYYNRAITKAYISATYKPFNSIVNIKFDKNSSPYIGIASYNDNIELSFSLPHLTRYNDAWTQYQLNNKNYKEIFENQVNKQVENAIAGGWGGIASGAAGGAAMGSIIPGVGTAIGAAVGALGGAVGGIVSSIGTTRDIQYQRADFEMQLGNIKAQPRSLSSVSEMDFSYKGFAYIEVYDTTDAEKSLFMAFYSRVSYTVNTYEGLNSYITSHWGDNIDKPVYFKGYIIQLTDGYYISPNEFLDINSKLSNGYYIVHSNDPE